MVPEIDLLVVDEAHNLKKGFGSNGERHVSNRNRILGLALGHPAGAVSNCSWYGPRVKRVLCLSATPFEDDYGDLWRQFDLLGAGDRWVRDARGDRVFALSELTDGDVDDDSKREIAAQILIRRVTHLNIGGVRHTKNMYRREWRHGGFQQFDDPIKFDDPRQRLIVGLVQKKVAEVLGDERFGNHFQIGMLSSFESFLETVSRIKQKESWEEGDEGETEGQGGEAIFDGRQTRREAERRGADSQALNGLIDSYQQAFQQGLPHPKLDETVRALAPVFETGEKALVFVRRVATVAELARRLDREFDGWIRNKMDQALPELRNEIDELFKRYVDETRAGVGRSDAGESTDQPEGYVTARDASIYDDEDDLGGRENFFSWFFRGKGPEDVLSGGAFQKNRLSSAGAVYSTLFEDDLISWLLGRPGRPLDSLRDRVGLSREEMEARLGALAWSYFRHRTKQDRRYPRYYVFESYQAAALQLLSEVDGEIARRARDVLQARFPDFRGEHADPPDGFPAPASAIGISTFFTELARRPGLQHELWPQSEVTPFTERFRRREQRRELLSAMARLGVSYIDLYLLAIREAGSFELRQARDRDGGSRNLARAFVDVLSRQQGREGLHAYSELKGAAEAFDTLLAVNFPDVPGAPLSELAKVFGRGLQHQNPVGRMSGGVAGRIVRQFRMPGFPLVLVSTEVLQEGEDLHTFCRRVVHYGITWTPSAMEQRTGRVDRIGSLVQRELDRKERPPEQREKIQVYYPHLEDTVERLQVRRVLQRLNRFTRLVHKSVDSRSYDPKINKDREILESVGLPPPVEGLLTSAFPVTDDWLEGSTQVGQVHRVDVDALKALLEDHWDRLAEDLGVEGSGRDRSLSREGVLRLHLGAVVGDGTPTIRHGEAQSEVRRQLVRVELRSAGMDGMTLLRCTSEVGLVNLMDSRNIDRLQRLQRRLGQPRLCARIAPKHRAHTISVEASMPFGPDITQYVEFRELISRTALQADRLEEELLLLDAEPVEHIQGGTHG